MNNNIDKEKLINTIISSSGGRLNKKALENAASGNMSTLMDGLSEEDKQKLNDALSDKNKARQLLSSKAAQQLLGELFGKGNG